MPRKYGIRNDGIAIAREATAAIAVENAILSDANYPAAQALDCTGFDTILVGVDIIGGASPTMTIEALFRDADSVDVNKRWKRVLLGARDGITAIGAPAAEDTGALGAESDFVELRVFGAKQVYLRIKAVANAGSTTAWKILTMPGRPRNLGSVNRS